MKKLIFILFILPLCIKSQVYRSGDTLPVYIDISPDTLINYRPPSGSSFAESYYFDANQDLQNDFEINASSNNAGAEGSDLIVVKSLNASSFIRFGRIDSVYINYTTSWWVTEIGKPLGYGDTINSANSIWKNTNLTLTDNGYSFGAHKSISDWALGTDLYIALKYQNTIDTICGWIRINVPSLNGYKYKCYVKDYSFSYVTATNINEKIIGSIRVYPNPATNILHISDENNAFENSIVEVTNYLGQTIIKQVYSNTIDVSKLPVGIYTLKFNASGKERYYSKFMKE